MKCPRACCPRGKPKALGLDVQKTDQRAYLVWKPKALGLSKVKKCNSLFLVK
jgi:hypothetical protein